MRLRESRRAALVALVGSGWENERSWVAHVYIIPAELILMFEVRKLWLSLSRSLSLRLSLSPSLSFSLSLSLNLSSSLIPRLRLSLIMIMKETERAKEKKEKQQKKQQKNNITRRNERKHVEVGSRKVASGMPWRWILLTFSLIAFRLGFFKWSKESTQCVHRGVRSEAGRVPGEGRESAARVPGECWESAGTAPNHCTGTMDPDSDPSKT